jgi:hypothetical protein
MDPSSEEPFDPFGLLRSLEAALRAANPAVGATSESDLARLTRRWLEALGSTWAGAAAAAPLAELWARAFGMPDATGDFITLWMRWYATQSDVLARVLDDLLRSPAFVQASARALDDYASFVALQRRTGEMAARNLPFATHADVTRLARLVIATEEKVDRLLESTQPRAEQRVSTDLAAAVAALDGRLDRIEAKLDHLLVERSADIQTPRAATSRRRPTRGTAAADASTGKPVGAAARTRARPGASAPPVRLVRGAKTR